MRRCLEPYWWLVQRRGYGSALCCYARGAGEIAQIESCAAQPSVLQGISMRITAGQGKKVSVMVGVVNNYRTISEKHVRIRDGAAVRISHSGRGVLNASCEVFELVAQRAHPSQVKP